MTSDESEIWKFCDPGTRPTRQEKRNDYSQPADHDPHARFPLWAGDRVALNRRHEVHGV
jgi:hypothetical protein